MARASDQKYLNPNPGYRKGDRHAGGGGFGGAGGKHHRPQEGWEKGDYARSDADSHAGPRRKPGRRPPSRTRHS